MATGNEKEPEAIIINEAQLVLAEKRTSLSVMRAGIAIALIPVSIISFLIVFSKNYNFTNVAYLLIPLLVVCTLMGAFGFYLVARSVLEIHRCDRLVADLKRQHSSLKKFLE